MSMRIGFGLRITDSRKTGGGAISPAVLFANGEAGYWYDPSDLSTLFQDTAGTVPVTAAGQAVARVNDKSGNGNHATASVGQRPLYQVDGNGNGYLAFDGVDDQLLGAMARCTPACYRQWRNGGVRPQHERHRLDQPHHRHAGRQHMVSGHGSAAGQNGTASFASGASPVSAVLTGQFTQVATPTGCAATMRINKAAVAAALTTGTGVGGFGNNQALYIGARQGGTLPCNFNFYGIIVRGASSNPAEIAIGENYLASRVGV